MCRRVIHYLHVLCISSSTDTHFTVVVAKSCTMPFGKTDGTGPGFRWHLHRWSETTSFRFFFRAVLLSVYSISKWEICKWSLYFHPSDFVGEGMDSNKREKNWKLFVSDHRCKLISETYIAPFHQSSRRLYLFDHNEVSAMTLQRRQWSAYLSMTWCTARVGPQWTPIER